MKEYKRHILWLDYFNSSISRGQGRRIPLDRSVKDPKLDELVEATSLLGYSPETAVVRHPKRVSIQSGCISIEKRTGIKKGQLLLEIAKSLSSVRGKRAAQASASSSKVPQGKSLKATHQHQQNR